MPITGYWAVFFCGILGGLGGELIHWASLYRQNVAAPYARKIGYWLVTVGLIATGGAMAVVYFGSSAQAIVAVHIGAATPLILQKLVALAPNPPGAKGGIAAVRPVSLLHFFRW